MDIQPKIYNLRFSNHLINRRTFNSLDSIDKLIMNEYSDVLLERYKKDFPDVMLEKFIQETYLEIKEWNTGKRLNGIIGFSGPLRYAFLTKTYIQFTDEFPERKVIFYLSKNRFDLDKFGPFPEDPESRYTIIPYLMHTDPHEGYSRYLKK